ncbi:PaaI family thioesterase [Winogradskya humida]|uniref:Acyl-coenzyme A thioesterase PaaI-like protein n=1 Tax=Winogradskya humida TaxID=113566 RepID=A0ABQ4A5P5_9ACTN|nr:PaaI family thioesterase [Actinoplanes humidus]GIE26156.1 hypothetical protein Ahu01nite_092580 [Actinoplanes humidus]
MSQLSTGPVSIGPVSIGPVSIGPVPAGPVSAAEEPIALPWRDEPKFQCFGCSPRNPVGLALTLTRRADGTIAARTTLGADYASYPGTVHGGILNVLVDEVMGDLIAIDLGVLAFCMTLRTKMLAPVRTGRVTTTVARLVDHGGELIRAEADVLDEHGDVAVMASGTYQTIRAGTARELMGLDGAEFDRLQHYFDHGLGSS